MRRYALSRVFAPETGAGTGGAAGGGTGSGDGGSDELTVEKFVGSLTEAQRKVMDAHFDERSKGLKSALDAERTSKGELQKQLRDAAAKAEAGSEAQKKLEELAAKLESDGKALDETQRKLAFYEIAAASGIRNPKLAYLAATDGDHFKKDGSLDVEGFKKAFPELFGGSGGSGDAGAGNGKVSNTPAGLMNQFIRKAAGRS